MMFWILNNKVSQNYDGYGTFVILKLNLLRAFSGFVSCLHYQKNTAMKTKTLFILAFSLSAACGVSAQLDTIFSRSGPIPCHITEVGVRTVSFTHPEEEVLNGIYRSQIQKIVFRTGRVQEFPEFRQYRQVRYIDEAENVTIVTDASEVESLHRLDFVATQFHTLGHNMPRQQETIFRSLRQQAAMLGGNVLLLVAPGASPGASGMEAVAVTTGQGFQNGVVYTTEKLDLGDFETRISQKQTYRIDTLYRVTPVNSNLSKIKVIGTFHLYGIERSEDHTVLKGGLKPVVRQGGGGELNLSKFSHFRVVQVYPTHFTLYFRDDNTVYNMIVRFE
jgi:hypothetical protein